MKASERRWDSTRAASQPVQWARDDHGRAQLDESVDGRPDDRGERRAAHVKPARNGVDPVDAGEALRVTTTLTTPA
jgi:hypothetical protein